MVHLRKGIALEAMVGFLEQFPRHLQVFRGLIDAAVPKIGGQQREHSLYIFALAIPSQKTCHSKGMTKIMEPWLKPRTVESQYPGLLSEPVELIARMTVSNHHPYFRGQECGGTL